MLKQKIRPILILIRSRVRDLVDSLYTSAAKVIARFINKNLLTISNHDGLFDGAGAQTQRILSLYCLANFLEIPFSLKKIERVEIQPVDFIDSTEKLETEIFNLNQWLNTILVQAELRDDAKILKVRYSRDLPWYLLQALLLGRFLGKSSHLTLLDGYFALKSAPSAWKHLPRLESDGEQKGIFEVHLHLRLANFIGSSDRSMDISFLHDLLNSVEVQLQNSGRKYSVIIHTDFNGIVVDKNLLVAHADPASLKYWIELGILSSGYDMQTEALNSAKRELHSLTNDKPQYHLYSTSHWVDEWISMASADILIMGKSSYSAVGGLLNLNGLVIGPDYWNSGKQNWNLNNSAPLLSDWVSEELKLHSSVED